MALSPRTIRVVCGQGWDMEETKDFDMLLQELLRTECQMNKMLRRRARWLLAAGALLAALLALPPQRTARAAPGGAFPACGGTQGTNLHVMNDSLIQAAERGDTSTVLQLLAKGAEINARDARGRTPVMAATPGNRPDTVRVLIRAGADVDIQDNRKDNPFLYAGAEGLLDILKLAIDAGASTRLTNRFGGTALIPAAERGHVEVVNELVTRTDVDVNHVNNLGWTALLEAIILGDGGPRRTEVVRLLVGAGADVNLADSDGVTPLAHARQRGYTEMAEILENAGASAD